MTTRGLLSLVPSERCWLRVGSSRAPPLLRLSREVVCFPGSTPSLQTASGVGLALWFPRIFPVFFGLLACASSWLPTGNGRWVRWASHLLSTRLPSTPCGATPPLTCWPIAACLGDSVPTCPERWRLCVSPSSSLFSIEFFFYMNFGKLWYTCVKRFTFQPKYQTFFIFQTNHIQMLCRS